MEVESPVLVDEGAYWDGLGKVFADAGDVMGVGMPKFEEVSVSL